MRLDRRGVEGLPFKLLITGIIMAVILPIGYTAYSAYDEANLVTYLDGRAATLCTLIEEMCQSPGNRRTFELDLTGTAMTKVDRLNIGGPLGSGFDQVISYRIDGKERRYIIENGRAVSGSNTTLELGSGAYVLILDSQMGDDGNIFVCIKVDV